MRLILLRHAKSKYPAGVDDHDRPLAGRGRQACHTIGRHIRDKGLVSDMAIVSTALRAQETWTLVQSASGVDVAWRSDRRIYDASPEALLEVIRETAADFRSLLVVGHNPGLQKLALGLIGSADPDVLARLEQKLPTAGLVVIDFAFQDWRALSLRSGELKHFATPRMLPR